MRPQEVPDHQPRPGIRCARICIVCSRREFVKPGEKWNCPDHGPSKTVDQPNARYLGQSTA